MMCTALILTGAVPAVNAGVQAAVRMLLQREPEEKDGQKGDLPQMVESTRYKSVLLAKVTDVESRLYLRKGKVVRTHFGNILVKFPEMKEALAFNKDDVEVFVYHIPDDACPDKVEPDDMLISTASLL